MSEALPLSIFTPQKRTKDDRKWEDGEMLCGCLFLPEILDASMGVSGAFILQFRRRKSTWRKVKMLQIL